MPSIFVSLSNAKEYKDTCQAIVTLYEKMGRDGETLIVMAAIAACKERKKELEGYYSV